jgi:hypothetical protein
MDRSFASALLLAIGGEFFGELFAQFKKCRIPAKVPGTLNSCNKPEPSFADGR